MKKVSFSNSIFAIVLFLSFSNPIKAQVSMDESKHLGWAAMGIGATSNGFLYGYNFNYQFNRNILSTQVNLEMKDPRSEFPETTSDISLLYGVSSNTNKVVVARLMGGLGMVVKTYFEDVVYAVFIPNGDIEQVEIVKQTIGIPIRAEIMLNGKFIGLGLTGLANINKLNTYAGLMLSLHIGLMR